MYYILHEITSDKLKTKKVQKTYNRSNVDFKIWAISKSDLNILPLPFLGFFPHLSVEFQIKRHDLLVCYGHCCYGTY